MIAFYSFKIQPVPLKQNIHCQWFSLGLSMKLQMATKVSLTHTQSTTPLPLWQRYICIFNEPPDIITPTANIN